VDPPPILTVPRGDATTWMTALDVSELTNRVNSCTSAVGQAKGAELEQLAVWLFPHVDGLRVTHADVYSADGSQEIDLAVWNDDTPWSAFGSELLVECKNWDRRVGSAEVAWFDWKMRLAGVTTGILLSANGITGDQRYLEHARAIVGRIPGWTEDPCRHIR
jgi:hypothetical protein